VCGGCGKLVEETPSGALQAIIFIFWFIESKNITYCAKLSWNKYKCQKKLSTVAVDNFFMRYHLLYLLTELFPLLWGRSSNAIITSGYHSFFHTGKTTIGDIL